MGFCQLRLRTPGVLVLSLVLGIAVGWIVAQRTAALDPVRARDGLLRPLLRTKPPTTSTPRTAEAPGGRVAMLIAEQGRLCVVNVDGLRVRREPGAEDNLTVIGGLPLETKVRVRAGPQAVAGSQYTWVYIESDGVLPAHIKAGWVAYELLYCAR